MIASSDEVQAHLRNIFQVSSIEVLDESSAHAGHSGNPGGGMGTHLRVRITCAQLQGKTRVAQHRLVYDACQDFFARGLHALAIEVI